MAIDMEEMLQSQGQTSMGLKTVPWAGVLPLSARSEVSPTPENQTFFPEEIVLILNWHSGNDQPSFAKATPFVVGLNRQGRIAGPEWIVSPSLPQRPHDVLVFQNTGKQTHQDGMTTLHINLKRLPQKIEHLLFILAGPTQGFKGDFSLQSSIRHLETDQDVLCFKQTLSENTAPSETKALTLLHGLLRRQRQGPQAPVSSSPNTCWAFHALGQSSQLSPNRLLTGLRQDTPLGEQPVPHRAKVTPSPSSGASYTLPKAILAKAQTLLPDQLKADFDLLDCMLDRPGRSDHLLLQKKNTKQLFLLKLYRDGFDPQSHLYRNLTKMFPSLVIGIHAHGRRKGRAWELQDCAGGGAGRLLMELGRQSRSISPKAIENCGAGALLRVMLGHLAWSLSQLHRQGVVHNALRPQAIQLRSAAPLMLVLNDFGRLENGSPIESRIQDPRLRWYQAPECRQNPDLISPKGDFWSLGMIMTECLLGRHPLALPSARKNTTKGMAPISVLPAQLAEIADPHWRKLCEGLLKVDLKERWDAKDIFEHWLGAEQFHEDTPPIQTRKQPSLPIKKPKAQKKPPLSLPEQAVLREKVENNPYDLSGHEAKTSSAIKGDSHRIDLYKTLKSKQSGMSQISLKPFKSNQKGFQLSRASRQYSYRLQGKYALESLKEAKDEYISISVLLKFHDSQENILGEHRRYITLAPEEEEISFDWMNISAPTGSLRNLDRVSIHVFEEGERYKTTPKQSFFFTKEGQIINAKT